MFNPNHGSACSALILAGGLGTRLRSLIPDLPKVLYPVEGKPFITFLLDQLDAAGISRVYISVGFLARKVIDALGTGYRSLAIDYVPEEEPLGTGGALFNALARVASPYLIVMNGDSYFNIDLAAFVSRYKAKPDFFSAIAVTYRKDTSRFGSVTLTPSKQVLAFEEKCQGTGPGWINAGIYMFRTQLLRGLRFPKAFSLEHELLPELVKSGMEGYPRVRKFIDIGTPQSYREAAAFFRGVKR